MNRRQTIGADISRLISAAIRSGASDARRIATAEIVVKDTLAALCNGEPRCEQYGLASSCPPHVSGPSGFRKWQKNSEHAIVVRIDVPTAALFSEERREIMHLLHEVVSTVEQKAVTIGYIASRGFAGGSCKKIFCHEHSDCRMLSSQQPCRYPHLARPSMSGFGIDVARLMQTANWPSARANPDSTGNSESMTWVAGLIVLGDAQESLAQHR